MDLDVDPRFILKTNLDVVSLLVGDLEKI